MLSSSALARRVKRHVIAHEHEFFAVCTPGLEDSVRDELKSLAPVCTVSDTIHGGVVFRGRTDAMYVANLHLSTASRVLMRIADFPAPTTEALYNRVRKIRWEVFLGSAREVRLTVSSKKSKLNHKEKIRGVVRDSINHRLKSSGAPQTVTDTRGAPLEIMIRLNRDRCTTSFNTSGEHLHRRGWRKFTPIAPIRENLAAYILWKADLQKHDLIVDPFCGSGTLLIEAAIALARRPPGAHRSFAFEESPIFEKRKWEYWRARSQTRVRSTITAKLFGSDLDSAVIEIARSNARLASVDALVTLRPMDAVNVPFERLGAGVKSPLIASNLPYGKRLGKDDSIENVAKKLNAECEGWNVAFVCSDPRDLARLNLKDRSVTGLSHGGSKVSLVQGKITN